MVLFAAAASVLSQPSPVHARTSAARLIRRCAVALAVLTGAGPACGPAPTPTESTLTWLLADGRVCSDAGVVRLVAAIDGGLPTLATTRCGPATGNRMVLPGLLPGQRLNVRAESATQAPLYRGELDLPDPVPNQLLITLYFTGGK